MIADIIAISGLSVLYVALFWFVPIQLADWHSEAAVNVFQAHLYAGIVGWMAFSVGWAIQLIL